MHRQSESDCPPPATVAALVDGTLTAPQREALTAHVADCDRCVAEVAALVRLQRESVPAVPGALRLRASRPPRSQWRVAAAIAAMICVSVGGWWLRSTPDEPAALPVSGADDVVRAPDATAHLPLINQPAPQGRLLQNAVIFSWQRVQGALTYRVRVMRDDGQLLTEAETDATVFRVEDAAALPASVPLYVTVTAMLPDGRTVRAPAVPFSIVRE